MLCNFQYGNYTNLFFVVSTRMQLKDLTPGESCEKWHSLYPINCPPKGELGSIRVKVRYLHEIIMPLIEYKSLKEVNFFVCL